jgi:DNA/RNA endonuclease YhcR with UshA esterase domain
MSRRHLPRLTESPESAVPGASPRRTACALAPTVLHPAFMNRLWFVAALSAVALAACDEASSPAPTPGTIVASVYVDEDISGDLSSGDDIPEGLTVALVSVADGGVVQTEEVGDDGVVTFTDVMPGSYRVQLGGTAPAGSTLSGSAAPRAIVPYTGGTVEVDFRFVYFPGSIAGRVYRDDNGDGNYDAGVDRPGSNLWVVLLLPLLGGEDARIDSVQTDAQGLYEFPTLAPQEFKLEFETVGTMSYGPEGATRTVVVPPDTRVVYDITFTGGPIVTIAEARAQPVGAGVTVRGFVSVAPNVFNFVSGGVTYTEFWIQDATGGIAAVEVAADLTGIDLGDEVEVTGNIVSNAGQLQIGTTGAGNQATVTLLAGTDPVEAAAVSFDEIAAFERQGELVVAGPLVYVSSTTPSGTGAFTATMRKPDGTTLQLRIPHANTGITVGDFTVGQAYYVTGVLTRFNAAPQIKPRSDADIVPVTLSTIAEVRAAAAGTVVATTGVVTVPPGLFRTAAGTQSEIWLQDATGGIAAFSVDPSRTLIAIGDTVDVLGVRGGFANQEQIGSSAAQPLVVIERRIGTPATPVALTIAEARALTDEGELATVGNLTVVSTTTPNAAGAFNVNMTGDGGLTFVVRVHHAGTGLTPTDFAVGSTYTVTGILTVNNATAQIKPRSDADVVLQP